MIGEVNKLIFNTLVAQGAVNIPTIGTIFIERLAADGSQRSRVVAPRYGVHFSSQREAVSLVDVISREAAVDVALAQDIFERWLDKVRTENGIDIEGVGALNDKSFLVDKEFVKLLNPLGFEEIEITKTRKSRLGLYLLIIAVALLAGGWCFYKGYFTILDIEFPLCDLVQNPENVEDIIYDCLDSESADVVDKVIIPADPVDEIEPKIQLVIEDIIADWRNNENLRHWVVVGSYSTVENAERAIADLEGKHSTLYFRHFRLGSMYGVSPFASSEKSECESFVRENTNLIPDMWIYTPKRYRD
ncbi:MAG: SPOR domain-containing protein [Alistipes sp.]|nr:SPOR domain-containing protein [Alistipes sp.]